MTVVYGIKQTEKKKEAMFILTILYVESVGGESQRGAAVFTLEAAAMEELALRTQPLHHVHALPTEEAHVTATNVDGKLFSEGALWENKSLICYYKWVKNKQDTGGHQVTDNGRLLLSYL